MSKEIELTDNSGQQFKNPRAQYRLSFTDYNLIVSLIKDIRSADLTIQDENDAENLQQLCDLLYRYFPDCKMHKLEFKNNNAEKAFALAIKMADDKPELYAIVVQSTLSIIDQYKCDMYGDNAPFKQPDWENIKYYKEII